MAQTITTGAQALVDAAKNEITEYTVEEVAALRQQPDVVLVDIRDPRELKRDGRIEGAVHCPRGMLEFWVDPESPYHKPVFAEDKQFVFFCAGGLRSALATKTVQDMGSNLLHICSVVLVRGRSRVRQSSFRMPSNVLLTFSCAALVRLSRAVQVH